LTKAYGHSLQPAIRPSQSTFIFRAGEEWLGIRSNLIQEVVDMRPIHTIPHKSTRIFRGLVNIRGKLELCVSLGGVLRIEPCRKKYIYSSPERLIVATRAGQSVVFPVSQVHGPHRYESNDIRPLPVTVSGSKAVYTEGILSLPDKDVGILDDTLLFRNLARNLS
jgi:chemotaxis signal transduction protein